MMAVRAGLEKVKRRENKITRRGSRARWETALAGVGCRACRERQRTKSRVAWAQLTLWGHSLSWGSQEDEQIHRQRIHF